MNRFARLALSTYLFFALVAPAQASTVTFSTPSPATVGGQPVSASATFVTSVNNIMISLVNNQANPTSVVQNLSDLGFSLSTGQTSGSLSSSSGMERTIAGNGTFSDGSTVSTGWQLDNMGAPFRLHLLGTPQAPSHTIIGPPDNSNLYSNAKGSIAGNGPHNPFLAGVVTFDLNVPGVDANTTIRSAFFSFGTTEGNNVTGTTGGSTTGGNTTGGNTTGGNSTGGNNGGNNNGSATSSGGVVPEPTSLLLWGALGLGLAGYGFRRQRRTASAAQDA
jgi:hypothetical protein